MGVYLLILEVEGDSLIHRLRLIRAAGTLPLCLSSSSRRLHVQA